MQKLYDLLFSYELLGSAVLVYLTLFFTKKIFPAFWDRPVPNRIISAVVPELLGVAFFLLMHVTKLQEYNWWEMALGGLTAGYLAPKAFYVISIVEQVMKTFKPGKVEAAKTEETPVEDPK